MKAIFFNILNVSMWVSLSVGVLYGLTNVVVGHPFDTIKTKMQGQVGFESSSMVQTFWKTLKTQGIRGLYRQVHKTKSYYSFTVNI